MKKPAKKKLPPFMMKGKKGKPMKEGSPAEERMDKMRGYKCGGKAKK